MTNRSTPARSTALWNSAVRCGDSAAAVVTPASRIWAIRSTISSSRIGSA